MTTDLALLTNTTITASCPVGWAQLTIEKVPAGLRGTLIAHANGQRLGPIQKELKGKAGGMAKAAFVAPLLKQGFDYLQVRTEDVPEGLPIQIDVGEQGRVYTKSFKLPLDRSAMSRFMEIVDMVTTVNEMAKTR
jgi:hypothetical protein